MKKETYSLNKDNMHHAYLLVGNTEKILEKLKAIIKRDLKIDSDKANFDFTIYKKELWTIEDSRNFKIESSYKPITDKRRIIVICTENIVLEAEQALLKILEEPVENTSIFFIIQNASNLLDTFLSRFIKIEIIHEENDSLPWAKDFIDSSFSQRQKIVTDILKKFDEELLKKEEIENYLIALIQLIKERTPPLWESKLDHVYRCLSWIKGRGASLKIILESLVALV